MLKLLGDRLATETNPMARRGATDVATSFTAARAEEPHTTPHELEVLRLHSEASRKGLLFRMQATLDVLRLFLAGRLISTVFVAATLLTLLLLIVDGVIY
jgi:hypothetical protein